jgi:hypothetical protein
LEVTNCDLEIVLPQKSESPVPIEQIVGMIRTIRGARVMLDRDLAKIYGVPTFRFNEAIKRNRHRFSADFMFQLTRSEFDSNPAAGVGAVCRMRLRNTAHYKQRTFFEACAPSR